jgi:diaminopimelate epimerase
MSTEFHKMHGAGNDFVLLDLRRQEFEMNPEQARRISDRRLGVGCDQILVLRDPAGDDDIARYEVWNADGSPADQCGNGARCIGLYLNMNDEVDGQAFNLASPSGRTGLVLRSDGEFEVDMGAPDFRPQKVPLKLQADNGWYRLDSGWGPLSFGAVSMGNPHALMLVNNIEETPVREIGPFLSANKVFPEGCNAGFAQLLDRRSMRLRVHERGAGETLACGSGACAAMAILRQLGRVDDKVDVFLPGGHLVIKWAGAGRHLSMKGPAVHVFKGSLYE